MKAWSGGALVFLGAWAWAWAWAGRAEIVRVPDSAATYAERRAALEAAYQTNSRNPQLLFDLGHLAHQQAVTGDAAAVKLAERYLRELRQVAPTNAFGQALLGSAIVMKAREAFLPTTKLKWVRQGCAEMDAAVAAAPDDLNARFTRASNNLFLPDLCGRKEIARQDFEWLHRETTRAGTTAPKDFRQYAALFYGIALQKWGESTAARNRWQEGLALDETSAVAEDIRKTLAALNYAKK